MTIDGRVDPCHLHPLRHRLFPDCQCELIPKKTMSRHEDLPTFPFTLLPLPFIISEYGLCAFSGAEFKMAYIQLPSLPVLGTMRSTGAMVDRFLIQRIIAWGFI